MRQLKYNKILDNLSRCERCGLCLGACPLYSIDKIESSSPRGKIHTLDKIRKASISEKLINNCLLCNSCKKVCPNNVDVPEVVRLFREDNRLARPIYFVLKLIQIRRFKGLRAISNLVSSGEKIGGFIKLLRLARSMPKVENVGVFYNDLITDKSVGLFTGCISPIFYANIIELIVRLYKDRGFNVYVPTDQVCCGLMNISAGDRDSAVRLGKQNIELFSSEKIEKVITPCASCAYMLREYSKIIPNGDALSNKVVTIDDLMFEQIKSNDICDKVAIHIPCHIRNLDDKAVYKMLKSVKNVKIIDSCCGYGGIFNFYDYKKSIEIGERIFRDIEGIKEIYTFCSGCFLHFYDIIQKNRINVGVKNLFELV
ncbi:MAG: (Fe-S)-binding protein [Deltaproteobacteria bacterium]|nr:(Fe-S)-binding protein [Deltaproteobacteria bacterium]